MNKSEALAETGVPVRHRRLRWNERVSAGDFFADEGRGIEPWKGPNGFRADSFVRPVYRQIKGRSIATATTK